MIVYAFILFFTALIFGVVAVLIYRGKTDLIHDYHQTKVTDKVGYGKAFSKALGVIAGSVALGGMIALFGDSAGTVWSSIAVLLAGIAAGVIAIIRVQKKYNGGVF